MARGTEPHPLQDEFDLNGAAQCGFCTPGILCSAAALLDVNLGHGQTSYPVAEVLAARGIPFAFLTGYGATNVRARYRKGIGAGGNVGSGKLTTLLSRPLGVSDAVNPSPATGGEDPETLDRARENAPLTTLTLDRAVSIADYRNFARAFAGIDKAHALWIPSGIGRGVLLTIAGVDGAEVPETSEVYGNLADALATYGDPLVPIRIVNHLDSR
ncbi:MAG: baseplate J/gp47 family protein, partial [Gemmatimonadetes bacterium]|nr:baseplate J/gp47 family protein [Gemmatimonadota bacterium]